MGNPLHSLIALLGHWRWVVNYEYRPVRKARRLYPKTLARLQAKLARGEKLKVVFLVGEISKWKVQSLYDWMQASGLFEPCVALTLPDDRVKTMSSDERQEHFSKAREFFAKRDITPIEALNPETGKYATAKELGADILFYYQPWSLPPEHWPEVVAESTLTCYVPYFVPNYGDLAMDAQQPFHRTVWAYFILNEAWAELFRKAVKPWMTTSQIVGLGHPMLDVFNTSAPKTNSQMVIYAPHWSIDVPGNENSENYSTFHLNGREMLAYAQQHKEFQWVFKPHPDLRKTLAKTGWSEQEIDAYYNAWQELGGLCETGDYPTLFMQSRLMITDCGSFLTEYACTGHPILHLICPTCKKIPFPQSKQLFDLYYQAHDVKELHAQLDLLLGRGEDPRREQRLAMVEKMRLRDNNAAAKIGEWLRTQLVR